MAEGGLQNSRLSEKYYEELQKENMVRLGIWLIRLAILVQINIYYINFMMDGLKIENRRK